MKKRKLLIVSITATIVIHSCQKMASSVSCQITMPQVPVEVPFTILSESSEVIDGQVTCTEQQVEFGPQFGEVMSLDPQSTVIYPMAVLNYKSFQDGTYIPVVGKRLPATISISLSNITGQVSKTIEEPSLASVREAIQEILLSKAGGGTTAKISWQQSEIYSEKHLKLSIGANYGNLLMDINGQYNYSSNEIIGRFLFTFTQEYYSIDADAPQPGIDNFFKQDMNCSQVGGESPVWVSSVKYGRKVYLMIESKSYDYSHIGELKASFDAFFSSNGVSVDTKLSSLMNEKSIRGIIMGGPSYEGIKAINDISQLKSYLLAGANFNAKSPGVPLSYTLRFVNDNSIAKLVLYDKFTIRDCQLLPPNTISFQPEPISDLKLNHDKGDKEFDGNGPLVTLVANLFVSDDEREVWARIKVNMTETTGDKSSSSREYQVKLWRCPADKKIAGIVGQKVQKFEYTDSDLNYDKFDFPINKIIKRVEFLGDTAGDDIDLSDIESTGHLHKLSFNRIKVELVNQ